MSRPELHELFTPTVRDQLHRLRHDLHRHPELSGQEEQTAARLETELEALNVTDLRRIAGTGIVARVAGHDPEAPVVAIRGDIDALPIQEETDAEYASATDGVMHACGHDVHAAWVVGAATMLSNDPAVGDVNVLLQPAEEIASGAVAFIEAGVLDRIAAIIGAHVDMHYDVGAVVAEPGAMAASADEFEITLTGTGCHAARPHEGTNPILGAAALVQAYQTIVPRHIASGTPAVLSVTTFNSGTAFNVIPATATVSGTVRATCPESRTRLLQEVSAVANSVGASFGLNVSVAITEGTPPLVNQEREICWVRAATRRVLGTAALVPLSEPNLGGEDFASYLERIPGCFFRVGGRGPMQNPIPAHSSRYLPDDDAVLVGSAVLAEAARVASSELSRQSGC